MTDLETRTRFSRTPTNPGHVRPGCRRHTADARCPCHFPFPAMTTNIHGSGAPVMSARYAVMLVVTVVVTAVACALGALIAGRAGLAAIPSGSQCGAVIGFALIIAGSLLDHHAHLTEREIALLAAVLAGEDHRGFAFGAGGRTEYPATGILSTGDCRDPNRPERRLCA